MKKKLVSFGPSRPALALARALAQAGGDDKTATVC